jgi:hypothetical protein
MKSIFLFPFRVIAFFLRLALWIVVIPLIIIIRILEVVAPEIMRPLREGITGLINIFKF